MQWRCKGKSSVSGRVGKKGFWEEDGVGGYITGQGKREWCHGDIPSKEVDSKGGHELYCTLGSVFPVR